MKTLRKTEKSFRKKISRNFKRSWGNIVKLVKIEYNFEKALREFSENIGKVFGKFKINFKENLRKT